MTTVGAALKIDSNRKPTPWDFTHRLHMLAEALSVKPAEHFSMFGPPSLELHPGVSLVSLYGLGVCTSALPTCVW